MVSSIVGLNTTDAAEEDPVGRRRGSTTTRQEAHGDYGDDPGDDLIRVVRERHRYELLWESRLPYPIHGIAASAAARKGKDVLDTTRRGFDVLRSGSVHDGDVAIEGSVALLEENLSKLLSM